MKFHIGIRVDEIVLIGLSDKSDFPTSYLLRNGYTTASTGEWRDNVAAVERLLAADQQSVFELEAAKRELADYEIKIKNARATLDSLLFIAPTTVGLEKIVKALGPVIRRERQAPRRAEVEAVVEALRDMGVVI